MLKNFPAGFLFNIKLYISVKAIIDFLKRKAIFKALGNLIILIKILKRAKAKPNIAVNAFNYTFVYLHSNTGIRIFYKRKTVPN